MHCNRDVTTYQLVFRLFNMSGWPSGLRRQTQELKSLSFTGVFWSTNVGVGSNPTSDKRFCEGAI